MSNLITSTSPFSYDRASVNRIKELEGKEKLSLPKQKNEEWNPDHTSRQPSPRQKVYMNEKLSKAANSLYHHKEQLHNYLKYYRDLHNQLQQNLNIALKKLEIKKTELITKIEYNYLQCINEAKLMEKNKSIVLCKHIKDIGLSIKNYENLLESITNNYYIEDEKVYEILNTKCPIKLFDQNWVEIFISNLKILERTNDNKKCTKSVDAKRRMSCRDDNYDLNSRLVNDNEPDKKDQSARHGKNHRLFIENASTSRGSVKYFKFDDE